MSSQDKVKEILNRLVKSTHYGLERSDGVRKELFTFEPITIKEALSQISALLKWHNSEQLTKGEVRGIIDNWEKEHNLEILYSLKNYLAHSIKEAMDKKDG